MVDEMDYLQMQNGRAMHLNLDLCHKQIIVNCIIFMQIKSIVQVWTVFTFPQY